MVVCGVVGLVVGEGVVVVVGVVAGVGGAVAVVEAAAEAAVVAVVLAKRGGRHRPEAEPSVLQVDRERRALRLSIIESASRR